MRLSSFLLSTVAIICLSCFGPVEKKEGPNSQQALFQRLDTGKTKITFNNKISENDHFNMVDFFYVYNGGGVVLGDLNNDGLPEVFLTGNMVPDALYLNQGNLQFKDISSALGGAKEGWSTGATLVDINHDGYLDIYVCRSGNYDREKRKNLLYINNGDLTFTEQAEAYGLADDGYSTQAAFFDYDQDGDLDMYLLNHTNAVKDPNNIRPLAQDGNGPANDKLYRNEGNQGNGITFRDVSKEAGIVKDGFGLGLGIADLNGDGWQDIFVTNDFLANDYIYINQGNGTFKEMAQTLLNHTSHFSMGNDIADFNNDGLYDLVTMDMRPKDNFNEKKMAGPFNYDLFQSAMQQGYMPQYMRNTVQLNMGSAAKDGPKFAEIGQLLGVDASDWSWAPLFADVDNDGLKDLFITNGYLRDITDLDFINYTSTAAAQVSHDSLDHLLKQKAKEMPSIKVANQMFKNQAGLVFANVTKDWGMDTPSLSNGAAMADLDNDGDLDLVVNAINEAALVYENRSNLINENHYLKVALEGDSLNPWALGAEVRLFRSGNIQLLSQTFTRGYQSAMGPILHFGLGAENKIDSLLVTWPDGSTKKIVDLHANKTIRLDKKQGSLSRWQPYPITNQWFEDITQKLNLDIAHTEMPYQDFHREFLLPHQLSEQGPGIAVGDLNQDGYDDFFMGGGYNHKGQLFFGTEKGAFRQEWLLPHDKNKYQEDTGVLLFDFDNDHDLDLYVASGSNEFFEGSEYYQDRIYRNDGKGNYELALGVLPHMPNSTSCVRAADFDGDGDLDLFVGGRLTPLKYPLPTNSYLLVNEGGTFVDATMRVAPHLRKPGMVKDALWTDYDLDGDLDLIIVGEFMAIEFYQNNNGIFTNASKDTGLTRTSGWWNSIHGGDFDNDGDTDYIVGNLGLNTKLKASPKEPMSIYAMDLDGNGTLDPIITTIRQGQEHPIHSRDELLKQVPSLKKQYPDYASYAQTTLKTLLSPQQKSSAYTAKAFQLESCILINNGNGQFQMRPLPTMAQVSPIYGIGIQYVDQDGNLDLILTGNDHGTEVGLGRYDASKGLILKGTGTGNFLPVPLRESGLLVEDNARATASIVANKRLIHLFGRNNDKLKAYATNDTLNKNKILIVPKGSVYAHISLDNGKIRRHEFYHGASYLSQSTQKIILTGREIKIVVYDAKGSPKTLYPKP